MKDLFTIFGDEAVIVPIGPCYTKQQWNEIKEKEFLQEKQSQTDSSASRGEAELESSS